MWEAAGTRIHGKKGQHFRHFKNRKIRKVRLKPSEADKAHNPCQEDEQCKQCMPVSEGFSPVTAEKYVLSSWLLLFCFVYSSKDKTKSDAIPHFIKYRRKHLGRAAKHDKVQTSLNRNTHKPSCSAC